MRTKRTVLKCIFPKTQTSGKGRGEERGDNIGSWIESLQTEDGFPGMGGKTTEEPVGNCKEGMRNHEG